MTFIVFENVLGRGFVHVLGHPSVALAAGVGDGEAGIPVVCVNV